MLRLQDKCCIFVYAKSTACVGIQGKLFSDTESIQARAEAAMLLKQLDFPVCTGFPFITSTYLFPACYSFMKAGSTFCSFAFGFFLCLHIELSTLSCNC